jgi:hypothetical protein
MVAAAINAKSGMQEDMTESRTCPDGEALARVVEGRDRIDESGDHLRPDASATYDPGLKGNSVP